MAARKIVRRSCLGARPRYNLVVDEDVKKPTKQTNKQTKLTFPNLSLQGLISLQVGLFLKFGLWFLSVMKASLLAVTSILSLSSSLVAMRRSSFVTSLTVASLDFVYSLCMLLFISPSY